MRTAHTVRRTLAALALGLLSQAGFAAVDICEELPALTRKDQTGTERTLDATVRRIYANADRKGDGLMKAAKIEQAQLDAQRAIVVADISEAPGFVKSIIKSSLKDRRYATWLDTAGSTKKLLPYKADQIVVIELEARRVKAVRYLADAEALRRELAGGK